VRSKMPLQILGAAALLSVGLFVAGCKSAPELTQAQAQSLIQAKYDATPPVGATVVVNDLGMRQGAVAKLWDRTTIYPNKYWADFKLTDAGKKAVKLANGGDKIEWRPESLSDTSFTITVTTVAANHLKAHNVGDPTDEMLPGSDAAKGASFNEAVDMTGVPDAVQQIARNPGNTLSTKRHADFVLTNGTWTLQGIN
jgi:hypothetical protein